MSDARASLIAKALIWRARSPSGRFVLHRIPQDRACPLHGAVTRFHMCKVTQPNICGDIGVARSAWMGPPSWVPPIKRKGSA